MHSDSPPESVIELELDEQEHDAEFDAYCERGLADEGAALKSHHPSLSSFSIERIIGKQVEINTGRTINSITLGANGKYIFGGGDEEKIRCWRVKDGREVGTAVDAESWVNSLEVSQDRKWAVSWTGLNQVTVWNTQRHEKVTKLTGLTKVAVNAVHTSPDGTKIATGSNDRTTRIWSLSTGKILLRLQHHAGVTALKFSPNSRLITVVIQDSDSLMIYDSRDGRLLVTFTQAVYFSTLSTRISNQHVAWSHDSKHFFILFSDGIIGCFDVSTGTKYAMTSSSCEAWRSRGIALANKGAYIAVSADASVSFWDPRSHKQIGSVIKHAHAVTSMALSVDHVLVTSAGGTITVWDLRDILPFSYCVDQKRPKPPRITFGPPWSLQRATDLTFDSTFGPPWSLQRTAADLTFDNYPPYDM